MPDLSWRSMVAADLDAVAAIAAVGFPDHFEGRDCFENRLALYPGGCFVLSGPDSVRGYLVAYPWTSGSAPALNTRVEALPGGADLMYLHDLALDPAVRGQGWSRPILSRLAGDARTGGWPAIALVAVNAATTFWEGHSFTVSPDPAMAGKLASYGPDARYMVRTL